MVGGVRDGVGGGWGGVGDGRDRDTTVRSLGHHGLSALLYLANARPVRDPYLMKLVDGA